MREELLSTLIQNHSLCGSQNSLTVHLTVCTVRVTGNFSVFNAYCIIPAVCAEMLRSLFFPRPQLNVGRQIKKVSSLVFPLPRKSHLPFFHFLLLIFPVFFYILWSTFSSSYVRLCSLGEGKGELALLLGAPGWASASYLTPSAQASLQSQAYPPSPLSRPSLCLPDDR